MPLRQEARHTMAKVLTRRASSGYGLVCGIGIYEPLILRMTDAPRAYKIWNSMLARVTDKSAARVAFYDGCSVSHEFHRFSDFAGWAEKQIGWDCLDYQLDKDILVKGNREYGPTTCVLVPPQINRLFTKRKVSNSALPIGVLKENKSDWLIARCHGERLGKFRDPVEAFAVYKVAKESAIKRMAELHRADIDPRVYAALMAYQVEITD